MYHIRTILLLYSSELFTCRGKSTKELYDELSTLFSWSFILEFLLDLLTRRKPSTPILWNGRLSPPPPVTHKTNWRTACDSRAASFMNLLLIIDWSRLWVHCDSGGEATSLVSLPFPSVHSFCLFSFFHCIFVSYDPFSHFLVLNFLCFLVSYLFI